MDSPLSIFIVWSLSLLTFMLIQATNLQTKSLISLPFAKTKESDPLENLIIAYKHLHWIYGDLSMFLFTKWIWTSTSQGKIIKFQIKNHPLLFYRGGNPLSLKYYMWRYSNHNKSYVLTQLVSHIYFQNK